MKRKILTAILLIFLALAACAAPKGDNSAEGLKLYFLSTQNSGPAITGQPYPEQAPTPEQLLRALLAGPEDDALLSPFPQNLALRGCTLENGCLKVDFSEHYGGLTDISLTLADYCVTLTLCQLEEVESVEISAAGRPIPYRSNQILTPQNVSFLPH